MVVPFPLIVGNVPEKAMGAAKKVFDIGNALR